jgi:hypothetical protein
MFLVSARAVLSMAAVVLAVGVGCFQPPAGSGYSDAGEVEPPKPSYSKRLCLLDRVPAYHYRVTYYVTWGDPDYDPADAGPPRVKATEEGWAVRGTGRRAEVRQGGKLTKLTVDTPRWRFVWDAPRNAVYAYPSRLYDPIGKGLDDSFWTRQEIIEWSKRAKATYVSQQDRLEGKEAEKITFQYLADPLDDGFSPIHVPFPGIEQALQSPDARYRTRTYWFDVRTHLMLRKTCGCKSPKHEESVDYPAADSLPREFFRVQVPRGATLEINDPELGRRIYSEGQKGPDLRQ